MYTIREPQQYVNVRISGGRVEVPPVSFGTAEASMRERDEKVNVFEVEDMGNRRRWKDGR